MGGGGGPVGPEKTFKKRNGPGVLPGLSISPPAPIPRGGKPPAPASFPQCTAPAAGAAPSVPGAPPPHPRQGGAVPPWTPKKPSPPAQHHFTGALVGVPLAPQHLALKKSPPKLAACAVDVLGTSAQGQAAAAYARGAPAPRRARAPMWKPQNSLPNVCLRTTRPPRSAIPRGARASPRQPRLASPCRARRKPAHRLGARRAGRPWAPAHAPVCPHCRARQQAR